MTDPWAHIASLVEQKQRKAVTGAGVVAYQTGTPISSLLGTDPQRKAAAYLQAYKCGWFYKAEHKISQDFANLKVSVAPEDDTGDNEQTVIEPDLFKPWEQLDPIGQFLRLMERPNPSQTGRQLRQKTQIRLDMAGWTYWYLENGLDGLPTAIYGISPARLWPSVDRAGNLIGWVLDRNKPGGGVPFGVDEILPFTNATSDDTDVYGVGVVEAVYAELPLTELMARHTSDLLTTGGRLAGMMWPKERALDEAEFVDAQRAWRNVASDPNAARRLLLFPEPMEWANGSSTPAEIGIPELASLNRDNILTAFPISPYRLGVPVPGGLNSAEVRKEDRQDYWEDTIHPRVEMFEETVQVGLLSRYEAIVGYTLDFEIAEPNLDDAAALVAKAEAMDKLIALGFDEKAAVEAVGLDNIRFVGKPPPPPQLAPFTGQPERMPEMAPPPTKAARAVDMRNGVVEPATEKAKGKLAGFFREQQARVTERIRSTMKTVSKAAGPEAKAARKAAPPDWWDGDAEDKALTETMHSVYFEVGRGGLQSVADTLDRTIPGKFTQAVIADLTRYGGQRVKDINERTMQSISLQLAEGTRRGYSIPQLIDGVPEEGFAGIRGVTLDNGTPAFSELRAETIARTETALSYNRATVTSYEQFGVTTLLAYDGDQDEECAARDGQEFSTDEAAHIEDHPNGTLVWSPVVDKAWKRPEDSDVMRVLAEAIKTVGAPVPVNVTVQNGDIRLMRTVIDYDEHDNVIGSHPEPMDG